MTTNAENSNSQNGAQFDISTIDSIEDIDTLRATIKEHVPKILDSNKQLFARVKKAEGFELKDGEWVKSAKADAQPAAPQGQQPQAPSSDLGELAFLNANGIKTQKQIDFVQKMKKETGKSLPDLFQTKYFEAEMKTFNEIEATADATPNGNKRTNNSSTSTVEYWLAKGELPPAEEVQLRRDVVNAKLKASESSGPFYNSPRA